ncbi:MULTISPECIES: TetR/AcrR family transcriptional regulator [Pseudomonas]|uniref:TetR/AcrR family transcriptional regulator n=1 Tax=Pseudomonas TaxID=286 RepID=UPI001E580CF8|nr:MULTISPECIES: TetR/AcrR family transcriptional regulator [Pseudomonas]MCE1116815.1 TetR/AcrR family transcriptional regulator [Pseudomonas sp. NMI795_08]
MPDTKARTQAAPPSDCEIAPEPVARRGRPVGDRDAKRAELLAAAIAVIAADGYVGASMRKVAKQAGCTTGAVTYYFANKEEMIGEVAQNLFDQVDQLLETNQAQIDIASLLRQWLQWVSSDESTIWLSWLQLLAHARHEPVFADIIRQRYARFRQVFTTVIETGQAQGKIRHDIAAEMLADQISTICDGWLMMLPIEPERFSAERGQALLDALILLISPPKAAKAAVKAKAR